MPEGNPIIIGVDLSRSYHRRGRGITGSNEGVQALDGVSLSLHLGECMGVVGPSGAGKSTLARILIGLERPDSGKVYIAGQQIADYSARRLRNLRRQVQIVFQDPYSSLDPRQRVGAIIAEPLGIHSLAQGILRYPRVAELLASVGLSPSDEFLARRPAQLSGGERQRLAIARALACGPRALILDEPVSALDVSVRGQILNLLNDLRKTFNLAMLVISHDLPVVAKMCQRLAVMDEGRIVEQGDIGRVLLSPVHTTTKQLIRSAQAASFAFLKVYKQISCEPLTVN